MTTINHWGKWIDSDTPTTGVLSLNRLNWDAYDFNSEICLDCEQAQREFEDGTHECEYGEGCHCADFLECDPSHLKLFGDWTLDTKTHQYEANHQEEFASILREDVVQVVWSRHIATGAPCSPCYPGQIDLDSPGEFKAYTLPSYLLQE